MKKTLLKHSKPYKKFMKLEGHNPFLPRCVMCNEDLEPFFNITTGAISILEKPLCFYCKNPSCPNYSLLATEVS